MYRTLFLLGIFLFPFALVAQKKALSYYLPDMEYDSSIPTPEEYLGYQIGEWHISHDQLLGYMRVVADRSPRVRLETYAHSYEHRPLVLLTITSAANQNRIEDIRQAHEQLCDPVRSPQPDLDKMPVVVYQGYTIHGDEASGSNAALLVLYYLAAGKGAAVEKLLDEAVILLDPCYNPDGMNRFASWVNSHKGYHLVADPHHREHNEQWPTGRTNHYWFDLNRDWLLVQHPESQGRIRNFHRWKPNVLTDHHEMGTNATFFFQPGIPSRTNPMTPARNQELTAKIADYHAAQLDQIGSLYYTRESFDDFYYGKGSTYPDINGSVGILFEQASVEGHLQESENGLISFPFAVRNQVYTSLSTQQAALALRKELLQYQYDFYKNAYNEARTAATKGYVFTEPHDAARRAGFIDLLLQHQIEVYTLDKDLRTNGTTFSKGNSYIVPTVQPQYRLIKTIFETNTDFRDSLFYDVSTWTLPLSFDMVAASVTTSFSKGEQVTQAPFPAGTVIGGQTDYAYALPWDDYFAPKALYALQQAGLRTKVATRTFGAQTAEGVRDFTYGTVLINVQQQAPTDATAIFTIVNEVARETGVSLYALPTGLTPEGIDLGSRKIESLDQPKVALLVGDGVNSYDAGEVWHLLDQRYDMPVSLLEIEQCNRASLDRYNVLVLVDGSYGSLNSSKIKTWVQNGGTLITFKRAARWAAQKGLSAAKSKLRKKATDTKHRPYVKADADYGSRYIGGAICEIQLDTTHPIAYGYHRATLPSFRRGTLFFQPSKNPYAMPAAYTARPLLSGYVSEDNATQIPHSGNIIVSSIGGGRNISFADNTNFRAFWWGTNKLFANALFFGTIIESDTTESPTGKGFEEDSEALEHGHQH